MSIMHCCDNLNVCNDVIKVEHNGLDFYVRIIYCSSCGSKKAGSGVSDGHKQTK